MDCFLLLIALFVVVSVALNFVFYPTQVIRSVSDDYVEQVEAINAQQGNRCVSKFYKHVPLRDVE